MKKILSLDGLRGIAVLLVLIDHFPYIDGAGAINFVLYVFKLADPGYLGVEIFFVLSGYLITKVVMADYSKNSKGVIYRFYMKRVLRIFPVMYLTILVCFFVFPGYNYLFPSIFLSNYYFVFENVDHPLRHYWSLAVEEQFYLFWPLVLVWTKINKDTLRRVFILLFISASCSIIYHSTIQQADYAIDLAGKGLESRMLALSLGGILAVYGVPKIKLISLLLLLGVTLFMIAGSMFLSKIYPWYPLHTVKAFCFAATSYLVFLLAFNNYPIWQKLFCSRALQFTGLISYGLYVYHMPVLFYFGVIRGEVSVEMAIYLLALIVAITLASWYLMEKPLLGLKDKYISKPVLATQPAS